MTGETEIGKQCSPKTLTIQFNDEQLPILPVEPDTQVS